MALTVINVPARMLADRRMAARETRAHRLLALHPAHRHPAPAKRGSLRWVLQLKGQRAGLNYLASFVLPIRQEHEPVA